MRALKTAIEKKVSYHEQIFLASLNSRAALYEDSGPGTEFGFQLYQFHNSFTCDLYKTFLR